MPLLTSRVPPAAAGPAARSPAPGLARLTFPALGTVCEIQYAAPDGARAPEFERAAVAWVQAFEAKYSRFRPDSLVSRINRAAGQAPVPVDAETEQLLALCDTLYFLTHGVLDPTVLPLLQLWNWQAASPRVPAEAALAAARRLVGWPKVERAPGQVFLPAAGMALDFGGFGKEYAVDRVADLARAHGLASVLVDFGHDLRVLGTPPGRPGWHIGLEDPAQPGVPWASVGLRNDCGIASSGDYLRCFTLHARRYGHILDPRTGWPVANGCVQATVIAPTCLQAGVLSTTAFVLGLPDGLALIQASPGADGVILADGKRAQTRGFFHYVATQ